MQSASLVFTIIFALIIMGFMFAFGFRMVGDWLEVQDQAALQKELGLVKSLAAKIYQYSENTGMEHVLSLPGDAKICFIDPEKPATRVRKPEWKSWEIDNAEAERILDQKSDYYRLNLFAVYKDAEAQRLRIDYLRPKPLSKSDPGNFCATAGKKLYLQNKGDRVEVSVS